VANRTPGASPSLTDDERSEITDLLELFENHGCGTGLDVRAQAVIRRCSRW
jgi:hypothetical protein